MEYSERKHSMNIDLSYFCHKCNLSSLNVFWHYCISNRVLTPDDAIRKWNNTHGINIKVFI